MKFAIRNSVFVLLFIFLAVVAAFGVEPWRPGHFYCPDAVKEMSAGTVPPGSRIVLEDGTSVDIAELKNDDIFHDLAQRWAEKRNRYRSDPSLVNSFAYRLNSLNLGPGLRSVEVRYTAGGVLIRQWKGVTHVIP